MKNKIYFSRFVKNCARMDFVSFTVDAPLWKISSWWCRAINWLVAILSWKRIPCNLKAHTSPISDKSSWKNDYHNKKCILKVIMESMFWVNYQVLGIAQLFPDRPNFQIQRSRCWWWWLYYHFAFLHQPSQHRHPQSGRVEQLRE